MTMTDVLIVGAGIVGLLSALELTDRGRRVTVIDAPAVYPPASWAGGGILSPLHAWRYADPMNRLTADATARYQGLVTRLAGSAGLRRDDLNLSGLWVAVDEPERARARVWARAWRLPCREAAQGEHLPGAGEAPGLWFPEIGNIRIPRLLKALRGALKGRGVTFVSARVERLWPEGRGAEVALAGGERLRAAMVLVSAGAWGARLLAPLGVALPLFPAKGEMLLYRLAPGRVPAMILTEQGYLIPRADGAVLVGSTLEEGEGSHYPSVTGRWALEKKAAALLPALAGLRPVAHWAGVRPGCRRDYPYLGRVPGCEGVFAAAGHYRNGLVAAPASAELLARLMCGERPALAADYSLSSS
jgi:glycine oxidase